MDSIGVAIIGSGVIGCAVAEELSRLGLSPLVLEQGPRIAEGTTARNSGVVHAGLYYAPGSLKARSCVRGQALLYEWCRRHNVAHRQTGKWIVATHADEEGSLAQLLENAVRCGVNTLESATGARVESAVPGVRAVAGVWSPTTGIVDPFELSRSFQAMAEEQGAQFLMQAQVQGINRLPGRGYQIKTSRGDITAEAVVNCAGLESDTIARLAGIDRYTLHPCRGDYFRLRGNHRFNTLVYPAKKKGAPGLGIHLTVALDGSLRLGPDAEYVSSKTDFSPPARLEEKTRAFFEAARRYLPGLKPRDLEYDSCGLRPKLRAPTDSEERDFVVAEDLPGFINLVGIESPGLTAARALAETVATHFKAR